MTRFGVFLRAVNLGSHNKVAMPVLRELAEGIGYSDVATYLQSGNLVVTAGTRKPAEVEAAVHDALHRTLGLDIDVLARTGKELTGIVEGNPFGDIADDHRQVHVMLLHREPTAAARKALDPGEFDPERFEVGSRCLYFYYPGGYGRSRMATAPWAKRLGVPGTDRNWRTMVAMHELATG
jgi:uncharacterized protein (DUF1697 family)